MADFIRGVKHDNGPKLLDKLKISFRSVDALVNHAKERKTTNIHIRIGVNLIQKLAALEKIVIAKCEQLVIAVSPTIHELQLECCEKVSIQMPLPQLLNLTISSYNAVDSLFQIPSNVIANTFKSLNVTNCENIEFPMNQCFAYHERLCISCSCNSLRSFIMDMFPKMAHLDIRRCQNLQSPVVSGVHVQYLQSLNSLKICGLAAPNLTNLQLEKGKNLTSFPCQMNKLFPFLMTLDIIECSELESSSDGGCTDSLNALQIFHCSFHDGESFPERWLLPSTLTSVQIFTLSSLKYLDEESLQQLTSLETLGIARCPELQ
ncbi:putative disease resistance protein, partial [Glycine soja]